MMAKGSGAHLDRNLHSRPLFCSDVINAFLPIPERLEILNETNSSNPYDALVISIHVLMLEIGFHPAGVCSNKENFELPENWRLEETYKLSYYHASCPEIFADITYIKVGSFIAVFAKVKHESKTNLKEYNLHLLVKDYVRREEITEKLVYYNLPTLSRNFKDNIGLPLIMECQEVAGIVPTVGFSSLPTEIKTHIMSYLDVKSLLRISCVNKELNELADLQRLWKRRLEQDFTALSSLNIDGNNNYKMIYKIEYLDRKQRKIARESFIVPQFPHPFRHPLSPIWSDRLYDFSSGVPPEVRGAFPYVRFRADLPPRFQRGPTSPFFL